MVIPVENPEHIRYLRDHVLETYLKDDVSARSMQPDGTVKRLYPSDKKKGVDVQGWFMQNFSALGDNNSRLFTKRYCAPVAPTGPRKSCQIGC